MSMAEAQANPSRATTDRGGLRLLDLAALVVGYSLAAVLVRAFWGVSGVPGLAVALFLAIAYLWLGFAMSGPFVLLLDRRRGEHRGSAAHRRTARLRGHLQWSQDAAPAPPRFTGPESAWLLIGGYWIGMMLLVVPNRLPTASTPLLAILPFIAAGVLAIVSPGKRAGPRASQPWTHRGAIVLLWTWPAAWIALIALTRVLV
jgi:hypothetical protein